MTYTSSTSVFLNLNATYFDSKAMFKFKKTEVEDVYVIGFEIGTGKYNDRVGYLVVVTKDKLVVRVGTGFDDQERIDFMNYEPPYVIEIKHYGRMKKSVRHPVFSRSRFGDSVDIPAMAYKYTRDFARK
jgi:ATP-dependent DNA ligase